MPKALQRIFSLFIKPDPPRKRNVRKSRGQSLVEVAIAFPVFIMLLSGVIEFGFILNYYLSLLDATRDAARVYSGGDPFVWDTDTGRNPNGSDDFYYQAAVLVRRTLDPSYVPAVYAPAYIPEHFLTAYRGRRIVLDPLEDDVIVTVYGAGSSGVELWRTASTCPNPSQGCSYHLFPTPGGGSPPRGGAGSNGNYPSIFTTTNITSSRVTGAPDAGILVVEVHYNYHHILGLPWMAAILPNPLHLQAYTIMPIRAGEPLPPP